MVEERQMLARQLDLPPLIEWRIQKSVSLLLCCFLLSRLQAQGSPPHTDQHFREVYEASLLRFREKMRASGMRLIPDCFDLEELEQRHGKWKDNDPRHILTMRVTFHGKGVNASSVDLVIQTFEQLLSSTIPELGWMKGPVKITALSRFEDSALPPHLCQASEDASCCAFNVAQYHTVSIELPHSATRKAQCWKVQSQHGRGAGNALYTTAMQQLGFPDLHVTGYLSNFLVQPDPFIMHMKAFQDALPAKELRVTLEITGQCAVPFTIEKQTLLRVVLPIAMERALNIYSVKVEEVDERRADSSALQDSAKVTLILGIYEEVLGISLSEGSEEVTKSVESGLTALKELLLDAGFTAAGIKVLDVQVIEGGADDTIWSSWQWSVRRLNELEEAESLQRKKEKRLQQRAIIGCVIVGMLSVLCGLHFKRRYAPKMQAAKLKELYLRPRRSLSRTTSAKQWSRLIASLFSTDRRKWADGVLDVTDVEFEMDCNGERLLLGCGDSGKVFKGIYKGAVPVAVKVLQNVAVSNAEKILKEITTLSACRHPEIVQFQGVVFIDDQVWLIMEYMEGGNLTKALSTGTSFRWRKRGAQIAYDVASALAYLHSQGVIHLVIFLTLV
eukprot:jgi/Botrbrau1/6755/Bobra.0324s0040.1